MIFLRSRLTKRPFSATAGIMLGAPKRRTCFQAATFLFLPTGPSNLLCGLTEGSLLALHCCPVSLENLREEKDEALVESHECHLQRWLQSGAPV